MQTTEKGLSVIHIVVALSKLEINDVDAVNISHLVVVVAEVNIIGYCFRHAIEHSVEISELAVILNLNDGQFSLVAFGKNIHTVKLVFFCFLVRFAFEKSLNGVFSSEQRLEQSLNHGMVGLVAQ